MHCLASRRLISISRRAASTCDPSFGAYQNARNTAMPSGTKMGGGLSNDRNNVYAHPLPPPQKAMRGVPETDIDAE